MSKRNAFAVLIVLVLVLMLFFDRTGINYVPVSRDGGANLGTGLFLAAPAFGLIYLAYAVVTWHRGFHKSRKQRRR